MGRLTDLDQLKNFLHAAQLRPRDYLGQNFLVDEEVLQEILAAADLRPTDTVLEVGPGLGVLTGELVRRVKKVLVVEKDRNLIPLLQREFHGQKNLQIIEGDILKFHLAKNLSGPYKVVANIPYYLTSKLFQYFLEQANRPQSLVLMVQKEVGERVVASPGQLSVLGLSVQVFAQAEIIATVSKNSFWPVPKVDSAILKITPRRRPAEIRDERLFFRIIKVAFAGKRKQIQNTLAFGLKLSKEEVRKILDESGISSAARPQDLSIEEWVKLSQVVGSRE